MNRVLVFFCLLMSACHSTELTKEEVYKMLEHTKKYPFVHTYEIYFKDSEDGRRVLDAGLEKEGYVEVERNRKSGDNSGPVITFTDKAKPFLLKPDKGQLSSVQKISIAKEVLSEVTDLKVDKEKKIGKAVYTTQFIEVSPFAKLTRQDFAKKKRHQVLLIFENGGWHIR